MTTKMTPWRWWVGSAESVDDDATYEIDDCATREAAIEAGQRETPAGERFHIIEARSWQRHPPHDAEIDRFARARNHEVIVADLGRPY